jgi:hypothetical protein
MLDVRSSIPIQMRPSVRGASTAKGSRKPSSVQWAICLGRRSPDASCGLPGDDNAAGRHSPLTWPCSGWGLPCPGGYPLGRWALTPPFHPYPQREPRAVCFLWHFPSAFAVRALPGTLPCGARTFLEPRALRRRPAALAPLAAPEYHGGSRRRSSPRRITA